MDKPKQPPRSGITWRSLCATLFGMLLVGMIIQYSEVFQAHGGSPGEQAVSIPAVMIIVLLLLLSSLSVLVVRKRLLTRQELLCVLYAMMIAAPMITQGMWHRFFGIIAATPREGHFQYIDAVSDKLWPHGPNLVKDALAKRKASEVDVRGTVEWREVEVETAQLVTLPVLRNEEPGKSPEKRSRHPISSWTATSRRNWTDSTRRPLRYWAENSE